MPSIDGLVSSIDDRREEMIETLKELLRIPAIGPENGGDGEFERARYLKEMLDGFGFEDIEMLDALDERVRLRLRPNIVAKGGSRPESTTWIVTHMDTVPPGDLDAWTRPPFSPREEDGRIYGLGAEDNGQSLVASLFAAKALLDLGMEGDRNVGLAIVADEEGGSEKGIRFLIEEGVFSRDDIIYVPDFGVEDGSVIEVAEKTIMWLKVEVEGRQTHSSTPSEGINALRVGSEFMVFLLDHLREKYHDMDHLFLPPRSTFEPTKRLQTVGNVNTVPGQDTWYMDCRILPRYDPEEVLETARRAAEIFQDRSGARINVEADHLTRAASPSEREGKAVECLQDAVRRVRGIEPQARGIGGGTCANLFRLEGYPAYAWQTVDRTAHSVDEYSVVDNMVSDAKVFAIALAKLCFPFDFPEEW
ncbi:MAG: M20 family metallo-hydrolase [Methanomassiliicoccales archaeon]